MLSDDRVELKLWRCEWLLSRVMLQQWISMVVA